MCGSVASGAGLSLLGVCHGVSGVPREVARTRRAMTEGERWLNVDVRWRCAPRYRVAPGRGECLPGTWAFGYRL
jgi:hypothetical protein